MGGGLCDDVIVLSLDATSLVGVSGGVPGGFSQSGCGWGLLNWGCDDRVQENAGTMGVVRRLRGRAELWSCAGGHAD